MSKYKLAVSVVSTKHADAAVLGYPVRGKILQGFSSPDEVSNGARIGDSVIIRSGVVIYEGDCGARPALWR
ncbi:MAG: hypothetical protein JHC20_05590 [Pyrobaculum sp.]|nr:hypothetical protein [Pyrobaculum sp.]